MRSSFSSVNQCNKCFTFQNFISSNRQCKIECVCVCVCVFMKRMTCAPRRVKPGSTQTHARTTNARARFTNGKTVLKPVYMRLSAAAVCVPCRRSHVIVPEKRFTVILTLKSCSFTVSGFCRMDTRFQFELARGWGILLQGPHTNEVHFPKVAK